MEFFEYLRIPQYIMQFVRNGSGISLGELYILLGVAGGAYFICLILGGLALFTMAERAGLKHSWLGFLPFANTYYAGKVAGESPFFGKKMKRSGLYAMIAEIVYSALEILSLVSNILLSNPAYYETNYLEGGGATLTLNRASVPQGLLGLSDASIWISVLSLIASLVMIVFLCAVYNGLYRKYSPRNAYAMTVFSVILPIRAFLMFAVRNNTPVDFNEYMKKRIEQAMQSAGVHVETKEPEDPFSDFAGKPASPSSPSSPFSEFDDAPSVPDASDGEPAAPSSDESDGSNGE